MSVCVHARMEGRGLRQTAAGGGGRTSRNLNASSDDLVRFIGRRPWSTLVACRTTFMVGVLTNRAEDLLTIFGELLTIQRNDKKVSGGVSKE